MRVFQLHFTKELLAQREILIFLRPTKGILFRVVSLPDEHKDNKELIQVLNTLALRRVKGIWFFKIGSNEALDDISHTLYFMDVNHIIAEPEVSQKFLKAENEMRIGNN